MTEAVAAPKKAVKKAPKAVKSPANLPAGRQGRSSAEKGLFATFANGGKQYRVQAGDLVKIEKIVGEYKEGDKITFENVLMIDDGAGEVTLGKPFIFGSSVSATLKKIARYKTVDVIKYKQKSRYFKKYGHRQPYFEVKIGSIK